MEEVESQMKKLETFQKALITMDDRVAALQKTARQLIAAKHMESSKIDQWMKQVNYRFCPKFGIYGSLNFPNVRNRYVDDPSFAELQVQ